MKRVLFIIMLIGLVSQVGRTAGVADNKAVLGSWKVVVKDVPEEYSSSTIIFSEKEAKLIGAVKFTDGNEIKLTSVKYDNSQVTMTLYVEGYEITINGKVNGSSITGTVETPDGPVNFNANKAPEKK